MTVSQNARRYLESLDSDRLALVLLYGIDQALSDSGWLNVTVRIPGSDTPTSNPVHSWSTIAIGTP